MLVREGMEPILHEIDEKSSWMRQVSRKSHPLLRAQRSVEGLPFHMPRSKSSSVAQDAWGTTIRTSPCRAADTDADTPITSPSYVLQHTASDHVRSTRLARGLTTRGGHQASPDTAAQQSLGDHHHGPRSGENE
jgi:hypothetical protein